MAPLPISSAPAAPVDQPSYRSPLLALPGAVAADGPDSGVAWHYGDPVGEQRAAVGTAALFDLSHRAVIAVSGVDRLSWLNTLTSQLLSDLPPGSATQALVLTPNGQVEHHFALTEVGGVTYLDTEPAAATRLLDYLQKMIFWSRVEVAAATLAQLRLVGPRAAEVAAAVVTVDLPVGTAAALGSLVGIAGSAGIAGVDGIAGSAAVDGSTGGAGFARRTAEGLDLFVPRPALAAVADGLRSSGARPAGSWAADALRIAARTPRLGVDTDDRTIPNEVNWLTTAVHLNKGCYRGQETVARVHNLGRPPRRLVLLNLDGSVDRLPETGASVVTADGRLVGRVGSVAHHYQDGPIALAMIKRSLPPGTPLLADGVDAAVDPDDEVEQGAAGPPPSVVDRRTFPDIRRR